MDILDVRRYAQPSGPMTRYEYRFESSDVDSAGSATQEFSADVNQTVVENFCAEIGELVQLAREGHEWSSIGPRLQKVGNRLYKILFPLQQGYLTQLAVRLRESKGIFLKTNEAVVPWETLHDDEEFFGLKYDLGRQYVVRQPVIKGREIGPISRVLFVADALGDLPSATEEAKVLAESLRGHNTECKVLVGNNATMSAVVDELTNGRYDLLHFSGHVKVLDGTAEAALVLHGEKLLDHDTIEALLTGAAPPVVFINGCASAEPLSNLCSSFMTTGSRIVIGLLHEVPDRIALDLARSFYDRLINRKQTAGAALRESRRSAHKRHGGAWTSFVLYGNPWTGVGADAPPEPDPPKVQDSTPKPELLDSDAQELLNRTKEFAASRGIVTSMDLLLQLLRVDERMRNALGPRNLAIVEHLVGDLLEVVGGVPTEGDVPLSDTVTKVVAFASELATRVGRDAVSIEHIGEAFVRVGGGTSMLLLESLGIDLDNLRSGPSEPAKHHANGGIRSPRDPSSHGTGKDSPIFATSGELQVQQFEPATVAALAMGRTLARTQGQMVGSHTLLLGFMLAGSAVLRDALTAQGAAGEQLVKLFYADGQRLTVKDFSTRCLSSLTRAFSTLTSTDRHVLNDADVLVALLTEEGSRARDVLSSLGVDFMRLQRTIQNKASHDDALSEAGPRESTETSAERNGDGS